MGKKVLIPQDIAEEGKRFLRERGYTIIAGTGTSVEIMKEEVKDCDAILLRTAQCPAEVLMAGRKLKVIGRHGVGVDNIDMEAAAKLGITVTYAPLSNANSVAEHTIGLMVALSKNLARCDAEMKRGNFDFRNAVKGLDLEGKTLGIVGLGKIGALVGKKAIHGFGMRVMGYDPYVTAAQAPEGVELIREWVSLFPLSDFVSVHVPASGETNKMISRREFSLMKRSAYFLNVARGSVVDEAALIEALKSRTIAGAGIDVYEKEPPDPANPLLSMDNVILTPHNASLTEEAMIRMALHAAQGIDDVLSGRAPAWPIGKVTTTS